MEKPEPVITQEQADGYAFHEAEPEASTSCPVCDGDFEYGEPELAGDGRVVVPCECNVCEARWVEAYLMYGIGNEADGGYAIRTFTHPLFDGDSDL